VVLKLPYIYSVFGVFIRLIFQINCDELINQLSKAIISAKPHFPVKFINKYDMATKNPSRIARGVWTFYKTGGGGN